MLWPDFNQLEFNRAIVSYQQRHRCFDWDRIIQRIKIILKQRVLSAIVLIAAVLCALFLFTPFILPLR